ncbi:DinB family protein [Nocardioides marmoriginsengisoli]|uniref:DinB family protein n=1 Tax=Nocardioides marmoriginsengisoli TaxID=661483 RepID=A0A3N0CJP2_9ACTN|nr:DinB family protein [Nocardioides marmoriginsengisoli]RNL63236.1 DinB family protein [Nocardioides marmoriginsengisoli]
MAAQVAPVSNETEALIGYIAQQQDAFRVVVHGLTDAQAGEVSTVSALTLGGLIKHVTETQEHWLELALAAPSRPAPADPAAVADYGDGFRYDPEAGLEPLLARFDQVCARVLDAVATADLAAPVPVPDAPWNPKDIDAWSVRWVWFHLIEELARHAGHADIIREGVDGATLYELVAAIEGWPETDWLKPWKPAV